MTDDALRTPDQVEQLLATNPSARVLDVRSEASRAAGARVPGSELLPVNEALAAGDMDALLAHGLPTDEPLVFVCNTGGKCSRAAAWLRERGFDAVAVEGGMRAWEACGKDVERPTGIADAG